jgi:asparagine synthetase B (glutamine-hydrolysing)
MRRILCEVMSELLDRVTNPLLLLSGGVDSAVLAKVMVQIAEGDVTCLTIGESWNHPDMVASKVLFQYLSFVHIKHVPRKGDIARAEEILKFSGTDICPGDEGVFLALEKAAAFGYTDVIAGDGIDEQVGGYWWHVNPEKPLDEVFAGFWDDLDSGHFGPMARSADIAGVTVHWPYMDERILEYISRIPLEERVKYKVQKYWWKEFAKYIGVPEQIADRPKQGFIHALVGSEQRKASNG